MKRRGLQYIPKYIRQVSDMHYGSIVTHENYNAKLNLNLAQGDYNSEVLNKLFNEIDGDKTYHIPYLDVALSESQQSAIELLSQYKKLIDTNTNNINVLDQSITGLDRALTALARDVDDNTMAITDKQDLLESGVNIKTVGGNNILGAGDIDVASMVPLENYYTTEQINTLLINKANKSDLINLSSTVSDNTAAIQTKQDTLTSGVNIKTINGSSILGEGNITITGGGGSMENYYTMEQTDALLLNKASVEALNNLSNVVATNKNNITNNANNITKKQDTLVSGTNIKTINGNSVLGSGNIEVAANLDNYYTMEQTDNLLADKVGSAELNTLTQTVDRLTFDVGNNEDLTTENKDHIVSAINEVNAKVKDNIPIGTIVPFSGVSIPNGWLACDGSELSKQTYSRLYSIIGRIYGDTGNPDTFKLPDLRGRMPVGSSNSGIFTSVGSHVGEETHTLTIEEMPSHNHKANYGDVKGADGTGFLYGNTTGKGTIFIQNAGDSQPHNNIQPSLIVRFYIIKATDSVLPADIGTLRTVLTDSTIDAYACSYVNTQINQIIRILDEAISPNIITAFKSARYRIGADHLCKFDAALNASTKFSVEENGVRIGSGVNWIKVSAAVNYWDCKKAEQVTVAVTKNGVGTDVMIWGVTASEAWRTESLTTSAGLIQVEPGDLIGIYLGGNAFEGVEILNNGTLLTIEAIS